MSLFVNRHHSQYYSSQNDADLPEQESSEGSKRVKVDAAIPLLALCSSLNPLPTSCIDLVPICIAGTQS